MMPPPPVPPEPSIFGPRLDVHLSSLSQHDVSVLLAHTPTEPVTRRQTLLPAQSVECEHASQYARVPPVVPVASSDPQPTAVKSAHPSPRVNRLRPCRIVACL